MPSLERKRQEAGEIIHLPAAAFSIPALAGFGV